MSSGGGSIQEKPKGIVYSNVIVENEGKDEELEGIVTSEDVEACEL